MRRRQIRAPRPKTGIPNSVIALYTVMTQDEAAAELGISRTTIQRIENSALLKLRRLAEQRGIR